MMRDEIKSYHPEGIRAAIKTYSLCTNRLCDIFEDLNIEFKPSGSGSKARYENAVDKVRTILNGNNASKKSEIERELKEIGLIENERIISSSDIYNSSEIRENITESIIKKISKSPNVDDISPNEIKRAILDAAIYLSESNEYNIVKAREILRIALDIIVKSHQNTKRINVTSSNFLRLSQYLDELIYDRIGLYYYGRGNKITTMKIRIEF